ncbi:hypothetical protein IGB42_01854 [Andreprevotia sp. IGB-42]|uniref:methyltransferase family protein n=1 Tax=Andreprevotia sp. IGB-42 TaxID=2497473 RepID=UPI001356B63B|nr:methyltransferase [Andreprevotia sp. IGB-42]KAF0813503.1 hypothetical protein IGB42_01854 [Andreprevotia sp. IGB-42]
MFMRALLAFLALPGLVAFAVPALWLWRAGEWRLDQPFGLLPLLLGTGMLLGCVRDFYTAGKGTLAPWAPPQHLVEVGLYRYSRNPMYVSVALILIGWSVAFTFAGLAWYTLLVVAAFHLRVVYGEEPWLARTHGADWQAYAVRVRRWL